MHISKCVCTILLVKPIKINNRNVITHQEKQIKKNKKITAKATIYNKTIKWPRARTKTDWHDCYQISMNIEIDWLNVRSLTHFKMKTKEHSYVFSTFFMEFFSLFLQSLCCFFFTHKHRPSISNGYWSSFVCLLHSLTVISRLTVVIQLMVSLSLCACFTHIQQWKKRWWYGYRCWFFSRSRDDEMLRNCYKNTNRKKKKHARNKRERKKKNCSFNRFIIIESVWWKREREKEKYGISRRSWPGELDTYTPMNEKTIVKNHLWSKSLGHYNFHIVNCSQCGVYYRYNITSSWWVTANTIESIAIGPFFRDHFLLLTLKLAQSSFFVYLYTVTRCLESTTALWLREWNTRIYYLYVAGSCNSFLVCVFFSHSQTNCC